VRVRSPGLRLRIALTAALLCLLVVGALGVTLYTASENLEDALIEQLVENEMNYLVDRHRQDPAYAPQQAASFRSYIVRGPADRARLPEHLRGLSPGHHEAFLGDEEFEVLVRESNGVRYYVVYEVGLYEQREQAFKTLVWISVLAAGLASLALGYWLSGMLVSQVADLALRVGSLEPGRPRGALARPGQDPEVALLARAFDEYQERIVRMIRREQEFTANASHELRTPLTAIKTSCELLLADPVLAGKSRARVEQISEAAGRMAEQIQALLFLARGEAPGETEPVALAECAREAAESCRAEIARKGLAFDIEIAPDAALDLDYQALRLVLSNLIRNAVQYTDRGFVKVGYAAKRLTVSDSGRGINPEHLPRVFERYFRDGPPAGGTGLGLAIAKGVCDHYGWSIRADSVPGQGSAFSIVFP
jgi:signal transduction histidine kinase